MTFKQLKNLVFFGLSALLTWCVLGTLYSQVELSDIKQILLSIPLSLLLAFIGCSLVMNLLRTWRYSLLLQANGLRPASLALFCVILVRNLCSDLLPARIGTLAYVYLVNTRMSVPLPAAFSSFGLAFLLDIASLFPLVLPLLFVVALPDTIHSAYLIAGACCLLLLSFGLIFSLPVLADCFIKHLPEFQQTFLKKIQNFLEALAIDLKQYSSGNLYGRLIIISILMRVAKYSGFYILFCALLLPLGYSVEQMPFASVLIGISSAELAASLPVSGIAGFGAYEGTWALTFEMLGFPKEIASLSAISHHLFTQVYGYLLGMIGLLILLSPLLRFSQGIPLKFPGNFLVRTFASALTIALLFTPLLRADSRHKDSQSIDLTNTLLNIPEDLNGQIVFDSNASGSFDIFAFSTSERRLRPLISTEAHEMYPDVYFKDGEMLLVYARTLSLMRSAPSDIWLYSAKSGSSKKIISDGTFPSFSSDGLKVYFERGRRQLVEFNLRSGIETEIIPGKYENWKKWKIVKPQVSADGKMVAFISDRPSRWHSWVVNLETGAETLIGEGCEPAWRDEQSLYFIQKQGAQAGSGIWTFNLLDKTKQPFLDFADPLGHEYFPRALSKNSVLYAAANADEHSHTGATYEIFWGKNGKRQQITQLAATSRWPKYLASQTPDATIK